MAKNENIIQIDKDKSRSETFTFSDVTDAFVQIEQ